MPPNHEKLNSAEKTPVSNTNTTEAFVSEKEFGEKNISKIKSEVESIPNTEAQIDGINQSVHLEDDSILENINQRLKTSESLHELDKEAALLEEKSIEEIGAQVTEEQGSGWASFNPEWDKPAEWPEYQPSPEEKKYLDNRKVSSDFFDKLRTLSFVVLDFTLTPEEERKQQEEYIQKVKDTLASMDFGGIEQALASSYRPELLASLDSFTQTVRSDQPEDVLIYSYVNDKFSKAIFEHPEYLSVDKEVEKIPQFNSNYKSVLQGSIYLTEMVSRKYKDNPEFVSKIIDIQNTNLESVDSTEILYTPYAYERAIRFIERSGTEQKKKEFEDSISTTLLGGNSSDINAMFVSKAEILNIKSTMAAKKILADQYGLDDFDFKKAWKDKEGNFFKFSQNLSIMQRLESLEKGSVQKLYKEYGIMEFNRYPIDVLEAQIKDDGIDKPYGVVVFPRADWNDAFDNLSGAVQNMYNQTRGKHGLKIVECESKTDLARKFLTLDSKFGEKNKISYVVLGGHGHGEHMSFGERSEKAYKNEQGKLVDKSILWNFETSSSGFQQANERFLDKGAEVLFLSCSTGEEGGLAQVAAKELGRKTHAPKIPVSNINLNVVYDDFGKPHLSGRYNQDEKLSAVYSQDGSTIL